MFFAKLLIACDSISESESDYKSLYIILVNKLFAFFQVDCSKNRRTRTHTSYDGCITGFYRPFLRLSPLSKELTMKTCRVWRN